LALVGIIQVTADIITLDTFCSISRDNICQSNCFNCEVALVARNEVITAKSWWLNQELHDKLVTLLLAFWKDLVAKRKREIW
jgi:hypothetical protein